MKKFESTEFSLKEQKAGDVNLYYGKTLVESYRSDVVDRILECLVLYGAEMSNADFNCHGFVQHAISGIPLGFFSRENIDPYERVTTKFSSIRRFPTAIQIYEGSYLAHSGILLGKHNGALCIADKWGGSCMHLGDVEETLMVYPHAKTIRMIKVGR